MKVTRLSSNAASASPQLALRLIEAIGSHAFATQVLESLEDFVPASHCTIFGLKSNGRMEALSSASAIGQIATITAVDYMQMGFDQLDSNTLWLSKRKPGRERQFWMGHQFASDVTHARYRQLCYDVPGIRERLSLLSVFPDGYRISLSLYRNHSYPDYSVADMHWLSLQAPILAAAVLRHVTLFPQSLTPRASEQELISTLSYRERQMVAHILDGLTTKEAAARIGIAQTTAATYRYRAFRHLGVGTLGELFALMRSPPARRKHNR